MFKFLKAKYAQVAAFVGTLVLTGAVMAQTVGADPFDAALATATTKVGYYAAALVGLAAVSVVFMIAIKYIKKLKNVG